MATKQPGSSSTAKASGKTSGKTSSTTKPSSPGPATKSAASKATATKSVATTTAAKKSAGRKYSPAASAQVGQELHEMHEGRLRSSSGEKVTNPKQAIAIGLSEARRAGKKVPPNPNTPKKK